MTTRHEIKCINKSERMNPHERILAIGGVDGTGRRWKVSQVEAIKGIERGDWEFYVCLGNYSVDVVVAVSRFGFKYLKTEADGEGENNLLSLPECPA
jgi:hypothetical protein